jgi:DNA-binding NarL/FixJ family response regulator
MAITIAIADPHPVLRAGIRAFFESRPGIYVAGECENVDELTDLVRATRPDVVVLDMAIAGPPFEEWMTRLSTANGSTRVILHGSSRDYGQIRSMFHAGIAGYVLKDSTAGELAEAIFRIAGGIRYLSSALHFEIETPNPGPGNPKDILTEREYEVFRQLGSGVRPRDIAKSLDLSAKTIDTYRANILRKLNLDNIAALIRLATAQSGAE